MSDVPLSLTELKVAIGNNILSRELVDLTEDVGDDFDIEVVVVGLPDDDLIDAAESWRATYPEAAESAAWIAERALPYLPDKAAMFAGIMNDACEVTGLLPPHESVLFVFYVCPVLQKVQSVEAAEVALCLEALIAFGRGE